MPLSGFFERSYLHLSRYQKIIKVLVKYGFDDLVSHTQLEKYLPLTKKLLSEERLHNIHTYTRFQRIRMVFEELGPTFIKFGQILSNRPDFIPEELIREFERLQDSTPTFSFDKVKEIVEAELGGSIAGNFIFFDEKPIASASIAQVHKARLISGEEVVVKVQRPEIIDLIETDTDIMLALAGMVEKYMPEYRIMNPVGMVKTFQDTIRKELDFYNEAINLERFRKFNEKDPNIYVPKFYRNYSRKRIITMEYISGCKITDLERLHQWGLDPVVIANKGVNAFFRQVFEHGFFHADPHPGNIFVLPNGKLCFLDFGMMGHILSDDKDQLSSIFIGIQTQDPKRILNALKHISGIRQFENEEKLMHQMLEFIEMYSFLSLNEIKLSDFFNNFKQLILDYKITVPADFFLLIKAISTTEGVGLKLHPTLNVVEHLEPFVAKIIKKRLNPLYILKNAYLSAMDLGSFIRDFPGDIKEVLEKIKQGTVKVDIEHKGLDPLNHTLDKVSNRISFAIIVAAMMIGSSLIVHANIPPYYYDIPVLGLIGFLLSVMFSLLLIWRIIKGGKM